MRNLKYLIFSVLFLVSFVGVTSQADAAAKEKKYPSKDESTFEDYKFYDERLGLTITPLKRTDEGLVPISKEEFYERTEGQFISEEESKTSLTLSESTGPVITPLREEYFYYRFNQTSSSYYLGGLKKLTADINCTTSTCSVTKTQAVTLSASFSVSLAAERQAIAAGASFDFTMSDENGVEYTYNLIKGESGYVGFFPKYRRAYGTLSTYSNITGLVSSKSAYGSSPVVLSTGEWDGEVVFVYN